MPTRHLVQALQGMGTPRVLVVGDLILDRYVTGDVQRISPEAPIAVLAAGRREERLGGAGNVVANLRAMDAEVDVVGVVGTDSDGDALLGLLDAFGARRDGCVRDGARPTTVKTRFVSGVQQMLRVDWEDAVHASGDGEAALLDVVRRHIAAADALVLSDYGKGVLTDRVLAEAIRLGRERKIPVLVDPKGSDYRRYRGATLLTPNRKEAEEALGRRLARLEEVPDAARQLKEDAELTCSIITLGPDGIYYMDADGSGGLVPTTAQAVFDVTGAGDTVISHLTLALADGWSLGDAVALANTAAGLVVGRRGASSVTRDELRAALGMRGAHTRKVQDEAGLDAMVQRWRQEGRRIVFTNGCFDVLHAGHVQYLRFARSQGDVLVVGINDDASVRRLKGPERPVNPLADRMEVLAALEMVDAVAPFGEDTPKTVIERVTPDVLVKGEDWREKGVVGREWVERHGGKVVLAPLLAGRSTTSTLEKLDGASR
ncbi:Bifunctional protein HldE [Planctomycetes bacterium Pla163]|uniref:Bifunctional protein HldE n=1 Tax=Rohdeia mirabilis TaxID=2528008 RepID=A0A518D334_9BACT|nr:Bifunctional protein HldE [Planctomycetes bacterium Pla163]